MKYCKNCQVKFDTSLKRCILCDDKLQFYNNKIAVYKFTPYKRKARVFIFLYKLSLLLNVISILTVLYVDYTSNNGLLTWSLIVVISNIYFMLLMTVIYNRIRWISKIVLMIILSAATVVMIGFVIKDYLWALNYVLPFSLMSNLLILTFLIFINKDKWIDYVATLLFISLLGISTILMSIFKVITVMWPTTALVFYSLATLFGLFVFTSKDVKEEFRRLFHI